MCQPRKWLWGLPPLALLWAGALYVLTPQIESELTHRATVALHQQQFWTKTAIEGRDIVLQGMAPSEEAQRRAMRAVLNTDGVRLVVNASDVLPEARPFSWSATRAGGKLTLSGSASPDPDVRAKIAAAAQRLMPADKLTDDTTPARGAPEASLAMTKGAMALLAKLDSGIVALVDDKLAIKGSTPDAATSAAVLAAARKLPAPVKVGTVELTPAPVAVAATPPQPKAPPVEKPYVWQAIRDANGLAVAGSAPSESAHIQVIAAAKSAMAGGRVTDQIKIASGVPAGLDYGAATSFILTQLGQMRSGSAKLTDGKLKLRGEAMDAASFAAISKATSAALPGGLKLDRASVTPPRVAEYTWSAKTDGKALSLAGYYPDEGTRYVMTRGVEQRFAKLKLEDKTTIAIGAPEGFAAAMGMALDQLSLLDSGEASIADGNLVLTGVAPDEKTAQAVKDALAKLVGGIAAEARLKVAAPPPPPPPAPPPAVPQVPASLPDPPATTAGTVVAAPAPPVPPATPPAKKSDAPPAPTVPAAPAADTKNTTPAVASASPPAVSEQRPPTSPAPAASDIPKPKPPAALTAAASPPMSAAASKCRAGLRRLAANGRIRFASAKAGIQRAGRSTVRRIAKVMAGCPDVKVQIAGHTDSIGSAAYNQALSGRRAEAVRQLLVNRGVPAERISVAALGSSQPLASNANAAGRARNRRIDIRVQ